MLLKGDNRVYFHGLDELRAIAALMVFFHHAESIKSAEGLRSLTDFTFTRFFIEQAGRNAVIAFFVLSGFLITYLLLVEKERTGTINIKAFYMRRILRIWPLYFLVVLIGFFLVPLLNSTGWFASQHYFPKLIEQIDYNSLPLFLLFLSNFALKYFKPVVGASQSWSVSVEEQFYLFFPYIIKYTKGIKQTLFIVIALLAFRMALRAFILNVYGKNAVFNVINIISVHYMFFGAIAAIILFWDVTRSKIGKLLESKLLLIITLILILLGLSVFNQVIILAILFAILILLVLTQKIEIGILKYFGKISYGIYMLHPLMLFLSFSIAANVKGTLSFNVVYYLSSFSLTILFSLLSYKYFESPILKLKKKHTIINSGLNSTL